MLWNIKVGIIKGKQMLRKHFQKGIDMAPNLHFEFVDVLQGVDGITILLKEKMVL